MNSTMNQIQQYENFFQESSPYYLEKLNLFEKGKNSPLTMLLFSLAYSGFSIEECIWKPYSFTHSALFKAALKNFS